MINGGGGDSVGGVGGGGAGGGVGEGGMAEKSTPMLQKALPGASLAAQNPYHRRRGLRRRQPGVLRRRQLQPVHRPQEQILPN